MLDTVVTWTLSPSGEGTKLLLEHEGFRDEDAFAHEVMSGGWGRMGDGITRVLKATSHRLA